MKRFCLFFASLAMFVGCCGSQEVHSDKAAVVEDVIMSRRSIRNYKDLPVGRDTLERILKAGINAPNGQNRQSWEIRVIDRPETMAKVRAAIDSVDPDLPEASSCFRGAPVMMFVAADESYSFSTIDCGLLVENMVLSAWSMGVGSICLGSPLMFLIGDAAEGNSQIEEVLDMLDFGEGYKPVLCVGFGYPAEEPEAKPRDASKYRFLD